MVEWNAEHSRELIDYAYQCSTLAKWATKHAEKPAHINPISFTFFVRAEDDLILNIMEAGGEAIAVEIDRSLYFQNPTAQQHEVIDGPEDLGRACVRLYKSTPETERLRYCWVLNSSTALVINDFQVDGEYLTDQGGKSLAETGYPTRIKDSLIVINEWTDDLRSSRSPVIYGDLSKFEIWIDSDMQLYPLRRREGDFIGVKGSIGYHIDDTAFAVILCADYI